MKNKYFAFLLASGFVSHQANAAISITNFNLTTNSVTFDISGTMPNNLPASNKNALWFVNPILAASPGFALGSGLAPGSLSFSGTQAFKTSLPVATGNVTFGDYFFVIFNNDLATGETVSGTLTATWTSTAFDPSVINDLNVYWGASGSLAAVNSGTFLTTISPVPEPSAALLVAFSAFPLLRRTRKM